MLSVLLVILTTLQVKILNSYIIPYQRSAKEDWQAYLVQPDIFANPYGFGEAARYFRIYEINWLVKQIDFTTKQYYDVENSTVGTYYLSRDSEGVVVPPTMTVNRYAAGIDVFDINTEFNDTMKTEVYYLTLDYLGPFSELSNLELFDFVHTLKDFKIEFQVENDLDHGLSNGYSTCYINSITQFMDFTWRGRIDMTVDPSITICETEFVKLWWERDIGANIVLIILIIVLSTFMQILLIKAVYKRIVIFQRVKQRAKATQYWNDLDWSERLKFFNMWFLTGTIANISNILAAAFCLNMFLGLGYWNSWKLPLAFTGLGCMFTWFDLVQFFEHFPKYYELFLTLKMSAPRIIRFVIGVSPIIVGFAMFGVAFFSTYSELFRDLGSAFVTLFALLNGDVIHDVFMDIYPAGALISRLYLYIFISLFIYAVLNIFIAIIEDGYFAARKTQKLELQKHLAERKKGAADQNLLPLLNGPPVPSYFHTKPQYGGAQTSFDVQQLTRDDSNYTLPRDFGSSLHLDMLEGKEAMVVKSSGVSFADSRRTLISAGSHRVLRKQAQNRRQLMQVLVTMQKSLNQEFLAVVTAIVNKSTVPVRPPHNPSCFPCDFDDCIYCVLKQVFKESLMALETSIQKEVQELKGLNV